MASTDDIKRIRCTEAGGVNFRSSYSMDSERLGSCNVGDEFVIEEVYVGSDYIWYETEWAGQKVWFPAGPSHTWFKILEKGDDINRDDADYSNSSAVAPWINTDPVKEQDHLYTNGATPDQVKLTGAEGDFFADLSKDKEFSITDIPGSLKAFWDKIFNVPKEYDITSLNSIIGMPFQFIHTTDPRIGKDMQYGRLFSECVLMNLPIATIIPGAPRFLTGDNVSKKDREGIVGALAGAVSRTGDSIDSVLDSLLDGKNARYYSFQTQYTQYMEYVNTLCRLSTQYLGIGDKEYRAGVKYKNFDWKTEKTEDDSGTFIQNLLGYAQCINVCYKPQSSMQESSSNSTDQSALASMLNGVSDKAKEADFLFGAGAGIALDRMSPTYAEQQISDIAKLVNNGSPSVFSRIFGRGKEAFSTVISGSNMVFPK